MVQTAQVIDLAEVRRRRAERSAANAAPSPVMPVTVPVGWMPVWFFMPVLFTIAAPPMGQHG